MPLQNLTKDRPIQVAMFTPWKERCGVRDYSRNLIQGFEAMPNITHRIVEAPDLRRIRKREVAQRYLEDVALYRHLGERMNRSAEGEASDLAHVQHQFFFFGGVGPHRSHIRAFLDSVQVPLVVTVHEIAEPVGNPIRRFAVMLANRLNFRHSAIKQLIVHTEEDVKRLRHIGVPAKKIIVVRHGVPTALSMPEPHEAKRTLNLVGRRVLTIFGFLSDKKGHHVALDALQYLPNDISLIFAGEKHTDDRTDYVLNLRADIVRRGLIDRVRITGFLREERIPEVMAATDIALAPYLRSSGSGSLANLLAYGRAIVASDIPPHKELLSAAPNALTLFKDRDSKALAEQIRTLLDDETRRCRMQAASLQYASANSYVWMAHRTAEVYRAILQGD